jgi:HK97 family phage portal protein
MSWIQRLTANLFGGSQVQVKKVGNQVPIVERYRDGLPVLQPYSIITAVDRDLKQNPFLYSALRKKADAIASVPFFVERFTDGKWVRVPNHEAEHLIEGANPFMSGFELKKLLVYHKELAGSAYWQIVKVNDKPVFLQPLFPQFMRPVPSRDDFIEGFEYTMDGENTKFLRADEVFWTKHADPSDPYKGLSPLQSISGEIQTDLEARRWNKISLSNRGASDVAFIMRSVVTQEDYELARMMIDDRMAGADNARRPWVLGGDSDVRPLSYNAVEMDYIDTRKFNRSVIAAALGVPSQLIGDSDQTTYNNMISMMRHFWEDTVTTWLEEVRQDLTRQILTPYYGDGRRSRAPALRYMYDLSNVEALQTSMIEKAQLAKTLTEAGFPLEQVNQLLEFDMDLSEREVNTPAVVPADPNVVNVPAEGRTTQGTQVPDADTRSMAVTVARVIVKRRDDHQMFDQGILRIHESLSKAYAREVDASNAKVRAIHYLSLWDMGDDRLVDYIVDRELQAVMP